MARGGQHSPWVRTAADPRARASVRFRAQFLGHTQVLSGHGRGQRSQRTLPHHREFSRTELVCTDSGLLLRETTETQIKQILCLLLLLLIHQTRQARWMDM